jgi:uncharacterized membrane protein YgcG
LIFGCALLFIPACSKTKPQAGLWSCYDTGAGVGCVAQALLSTADVDIDGDGHADHFLCADDADDGHDRSRDKDHGSVDSTDDVADDDHDGVADDLDCDNREACKSLSNEDNDDRDDDGAEHESRSLSTGGEDGEASSSDSSDGHGGGDGSIGGGSGAHSEKSGGKRQCEMHTTTTCQPPTIPPTPPPVPAPAPAPTPGIP